MRTESDAQIASGLRQRDPDAWAALYRTHFDAVWRSVARIVGPNSADVADVVQETFMAAARSVDSYDPKRGSLQLWLAGIGRNVAGSDFARVATWQPAWPSVWRSGSTAATLPRRSPWPRRNKQRPFEMF